MNRKGSVSQQADPADAQDKGSARTIENRALECSRIVTRLLDLIDRHVASLLKSELTISWADMQLVLLALEADADGRDVNIHLDGGDEIAAYVRRNLFDELVGEPSNIFYTVQVDAKTVRYEALPKDFWKECIALLREKLRDLRKK
ncbi:MAG: hypothetical protein O2830_06655 [Verrucomicrobia bacterium]|nr:hypothetical protein [Verrucomicrobiota bacterium]MDA0858846.1 hypothetical protein [Verrucomicrobiota bacterium]